MIDVFYYSIASHKVSKAIDLVLSELREAPYMSSKEKLVIKHTQEVAEHGAYPSKSYYSLYYSEPEFTYRSLAEILSYAGKMKDFYQMQSMQTEVIKVINTSDSFKQMIGSFSRLCLDANNAVSDDTLDRFKTYTYKDAEDRPFEEGIKLGIPEIDSITNGFQRGTVGSVCAFVGEGKSTVWNSCLFKNAHENKKCVLVSLEMPVELVSLMIESRYLFEVKGMEINSQDLVMHKLSGEQKKLVDKYDNDYREDIGKNLLIVDETVLNKAIVSDYNQIANLYSKFEKSLGGLDMVVWDHVGQLELMFPDMGNQIVRNITSATKTWFNESGVHVFTGFAVQCNREGRKRAQKRGGVYDLQAISELNEIEKSSTYCIFFFTSDDSKIVQETRVMMLKHRLGPVLTEPAVVTFNPAVCLVGSQISTIEVTDDFDTTGDGMDFNDSMSADF